MTCVPCIAWIRRGVAKETPEKISLTKGEIKELLDGNVEETEEDEIEDSSSGDENKNGSNSVRNFPEGEQVEETNDDPLRRYDLENYDKEDAVSSGTSGLRGLTCFSSNDDDPYVTLRDEDDESDIEDFQIRPNDNIIALGVVGEDSNNIEFYIYNEDENNFFVHHDILLPTMPLCMEWLDYEADAANRGNYLAVGGMSPSIEVWDVDVVDCLEPAFVLGGSKNKKIKAGHTDAVLDLAWNSHVRHILASGSADFTAALWDLCSGKVVNSLKHFAEKVQSLQWHPFEPQNLLIGSCDESMTLTDCRVPEKVARKWKCDGEVENVLWNHFDPFYCLASTDRGFVHCYDARADVVLWTLSAHSTSCSGLCLSSQCPGLLVTASVDERIKVWDILDHNPTFIYESKLKLGKLHSIAVSPDSPFIVCAGGDSKKNYYKLMNLLTNSAVQNRFKDRGLLFPNVSENALQASPDNEELIGSGAEQSLSSMEALHLSEKKRSTKKTKKEKEKPLDE